LFLRLGYVRLVVRNLFLRLPRTADLGWQVLCLVLLHSCDIRQQLLQDCNLLLRCRPLLRQSCAFTLQLVLYPHKHSRQQGWY
jgi:hypothetical protein